MIKKTFFQKIMCVAIRLKEIKMGLTDMFLVFMTAIMLLFCFGCQPVDYCYYDIFNGYAEECYVRSDS